MSEFALKTALPQYLTREQERIEKIAAAEGLDFFPTVFEILTYDQMNEIAAYGGFPNRYPHWRYGMEYERLAKSYEYGLSKIYEMVINNNPSYAYLLEGNSLTDQKLVMAHVYGHVDFFKNNFCFRSTDLDTGGRTTNPGQRPKNYDPNRRWIDKMANHGSRVRRHVARHGINKVEDFIDQCLSLENLIDPHAAFSGKHPVKDPDEEEKATEIPRLRAKDYMESFINPEEYLEEQRQKIQAEKEREKKFPARPERDVLKFLMDHAPLERWERDILEIIREEALYFVPQMQTKVMNEGWACVKSDTLVFTQAGLIPMEAVVAGDSSVVSDGATPRHVYDRNIIRDHATVKLRTRRGLELEGSNNHRVLLADGQWRRLDALAVGDRVLVSGGAGLWPTEPVAIDWRATPAVTLEAVAADAGVSAWTVLRHRAGRPTRSAARIDAALVRYEAQGTQVIPARAMRDDIALPASMTEQLAAFLGYLIGDGHISLVKRHFGLTTGDEAQAIAFAKLGEDLFGLTPRIKPDGGRVRVLFHAQLVSQFLIEALGLTSGPSAPQKSIPRAVLRSPEAVVRSFLRAYFDCDGHAGPSGVILSTTSDALAEQTQLLLLNFGVLSRRRRAKDGCWRVQIQGESAEVFSRRVGFGLVRKQRALDAYVTDRRWFKEEEWDDEIVSLEPSRADVYDISVRDTHRYAAAGLVNHNSYWHSKLMTTKILDASEIIDYADNNAGVLATSGGRLNPYKLGVELYRNIEERWNRGQFGKEWEECDDLDAKKHWNLRLDLGKQKIFEVRALYNDVTFIDEFLTPEFCRDHKLFSFSWSNRNERYEIETREFKAVKEKLLFQLTNAGNPFIYVEDANYDNRGELLLKHDHQGIDLRADYAREVMKSLVRVWKRPVNLLTLVEGKQVMIRFDGREHSTRHMRP
ncbi:MAG: SpoVR family protein [Labilithrix sp.]|nr:SpoVR family protein [Labilithrix sp.]